MENNRVIEQFAQNHNHYYGTCFTSRTIHLRPGDEKIIQDFVEFWNKNYLSGSNAEQRLKEYFQFQFEYWVKFKKDFILIHWVVGNKAIYRWMSKNKGMNREWKHDKKPPKEKPITDPIEKIVYDMNHPPVSKVDPRALALWVSPEDEKERRKYYNTPEGFVWCVYIVPRLYNRKSLLCQGCNNKEDCLKLLKHRLPNLHKIMMEK